MAVTAPNPDLPRPHGLHDPGGVPVSATAEYRRSTLYWRNETGRPLIDEDAEALLGHELTVGMADIPLVSGTVTNARILEDGARVEVTLEQGGQQCPACGHIYPPAEATSELVRIDYLQKRMPTIYDSPVYDLLTPWAKVCFHASTCLFRRMEQ